jgi:hypothetical protein
MILIATPLGKTIDKDEEARNNFNLASFEENDTVQKLKQNLFNNNRLLMDFGFSDQKS